MTFGPKEKVIFDDSLKAFQEVEDRANQFLAENKDEKIQGTINLIGIANLIPGNTLIVDLPFEGINNQTYQILNVRYIFNPKTIQNDKVIQVKVNKHISDFVDMLADNLNRLKRIEAGPLEGKLTRLELAQNDLIVSVHHEVYTGGIGSNFIFHNPTNGLFESTDSHLGVGGLNQQVLGSIFFDSGGDF